MNSEKSVTGEAVINVNSYIFREAEKLVDGATLHAAHMIIFGKTAHAAEFFGVTIRSLQRWWYDSTANVPRSVLILTAIMMHNDQIKREILKDA